MPYTLPVSYQQANLQHNLLQYVLSSNPKKYKIEYDDETFLEKEEKLAGRIWITISFPGEKPKKMEMFLIPEYKDNKIYRLWELTYSDWSQFPEFQT